MENQNEIWKDIPGYEGLYQASNLGNIRRFTKKDRILKPGKMKGGYLLVGLCKNGSSKYFRVHQLICITFLNHIPNGHKITVDHINNIPYDNRVENLQLISNRENTSKDRDRELPTGVYRRGNKYYAQIRINHDKKNLGTFKTPEEASQAYQNALLTLN